jgi:hypothetical protein
MDFGICGKSFRHDIAVFDKVGKFINLLYFLVWHLVANACKYSLNRIGDKRQTILGSRP